MGAFISNVKKDGIKIKKSNLVIMILCCVLCCCILYSSFQIKTKYGEITYTMNDYSDCSKAVNNFNEACDFLTNQARLFVVEKDISFAKNYFREYSEFQNREKSIEVIEITHVNDSPDINMQMAYDESKYISENEIYAMTLVFESLNLDYSDYPTIIKSKMFTNEDTLLSAEEKSDKAQNLLFGSKYQSSKDRINKYTSAAMSDILQQYLTVEENDNNRFSKYLYIQFIIIITLLCVSILFFVLLYILVLKPLEYNIKSIREEKKMSVSGAYEMRLIAKTYNALREKNEIRASILKHKAEHDPLTGLINREAFTKIKEVMSDTSEAVAYLIIDIDFFKSINDRYGHLTGDEVLKKIKTNVKYVPGLNRTLLDYLLTSGTCICGTTITEEEHKQLNDLLEVLPPKSYQSLFHDYIRKCRDYADTYIQNENEPDSLEEINSILMSFIAKEFEEELRSVEIKRGSKLEEKIQDVFY